MNWSAAPNGLINNAVSVYATSAAGCVSPTVTLNVFILQIIPIITAIGPFCQGAACVPLVATPIGGVFSGTGVVGNTFCPSVSGVGVFNVNYTITQGGCTFNTSTSVTVTTLPSLSPISHN